MLQRLLEFFQASRFNLSAVGCDETTFMDLGGGRMSLVYLSDLANNFLSPLIHKARRCNRKSVINYKPDNLFERPFKTTETYVVLIKKVFFSFL